MTSSKEELQGLNPNTSQQTSSSPTIQSFVESSYKPGKSDPAKELVVAFLTKICNCADRVDFENILVNPSMAEDGFVFSRKIIENYKSDIDNEEVPEALHKSLRNVLPSLFAAVKVGNADTISGDEDNLKVDKSVVEFIDKHYGRKLPSMTLLKTIQTNMSSVEAFLAMRGWQAWEIKNFKSDWVVTMCGIVQKVEEEAKASSPPRPTVQPDI